MPNLRINNVTLTIGNVALTINGPDFAIPTTPPPNTYFFECQDGQTLSQILYQEYGYANSELLNEVVSLNGQHIDTFARKLTIGITLILPIKTTDEIPTITVKTLW